MISPLLTQRAKRAVDAFTLLELLVVLMVMGLLAAVILPSVAGNQFTASASGAVYTVKADLDQARWEAIQGRTRARLAICLPGNAALDDRLGRATSLRYYGVLRWDRDDGQWGLVGNWRSLPDGLAFLDSDGPAPGGSPGDWGGLTQESSETLAFDLNGDATLGPSEVVTVASVEFRADGSAAPIAGGAGGAGGSIDSAVIWLGAGSVAADGFNAQRATAVRSVVVDLETGGVKVEG